MSRKKPLIPGQIVQVSVKVFDPKYELTSKDRDVLLALLHHGGENSSGIFPAYSRLMTLTGTKGRATIAKSLSRLRARGIISWDQGNTGRSNLYEIHPFGRWIPVQKLNGSTSSKTEHPQFNIRTAGCSKIEPQPYPLNYIHEPLRDTPLPGGRSTPPEPVTDFASALASVDMSGFSKEIAAAALKIRDTLSLGGSTDEAKT